jgi:hypothetical protein
MELSRSHDPDYGLGRLTQVNPIYFCSESTGLYRVDLYTV